MLKKSIATPRHNAVRRFLAALRKAKGWNQRQLSRKLGRVQTVVARIETGERRVDLPEFFEICRTLGVDPEKMAAQLFREFKRLEAKP